jgi:N-acetylglucosaminyldiphosphoundecaprenol N-acetyl-beta-D-mannosaminyltransferase
MKIKSCNILGVKINAVTKRQAVDLADSFVSSGQSHQVCVPNVWCTVLMQKDSQFRDITNQSSLSIPDGMPLTWISRLYGIRVPERVTGSDFFHGCAELAQNKGYTFFFLGSRKPVLNAIKKNLRQEYPELRIAGTYSPPHTERFSDRETQDMIDRVKEAKPHFLWVGLSAPKQEKWIRDHLYELDVPVCVGVGAVFDFIAHKMKRAPVFMQKSGLEWLYRLYKEPFRLWRRYFIGNVLFVWYLLVDMVRSRI